MTQDDSIEDILNGTVALEHVRELLCLHHSRCVETLHLHCAFPCGFTFEKHGRFSGSVRYMIDRSEHNRLL